MNELELVRELDAHDALVARCVAGELTFAEFDAAYQAFYMHVALDGHESNAEGQALLGRFRGRIALHRAIWDTIETKVTDERYLDNPVVIAKGFIGPREAISRLRILWTAFRKLWTGGANELHFWISLAEVMNEACPVDVRSELIYAASEEQSFYERLAESGALALVSGEVDGATWRAILDARHPQLGRLLEARRLAVGLADGSIDLVDGCRGLCELRDDDAELVPQRWLGWAAQLDDLPSVRVSAHWHAEPLAEILAPAAGYEPAVKASAAEVVEHAEAMIVRCLAEKRA